MASAASQIRFLRISTSEKKSSSNMSSPAEPRMPESILVLRCTRLEFIASGKLFQEQEPNKSFDLGGSNPVSLAIAEAPPSSAVATAAAAMGLPPPLPFVVAPLVSVFSEEDLVARAKPLVSLRGKREGGGGAEEGGGRREGGIVEGGGAGFGFASGVQRS